MPLNQTTGFPIASKLVEKKWEQRRMKMHEQKISDVAPLVKTAPPKVYPHMILRLKKIQSEESKQAEIDKDNQILLQRMTWVLKRKGQIDNWNDYRRMSMNKLVREREQLKIAEKNLGIAKKLDSVKPYYSANEWEEDYEKRGVLQGQWNKSTKNFDTVSTPRGSMASRRANSYESLPKLYLKIYCVDKKDRRGGQKSKSDSVPSSVTKLPKIHSNASTKDLLSDKDAKMLFRAVKNLISPEEVVIKTLIRRTPKQRMLNKDRFEETYEISLGGELKKVLGSAHFTLIDCLLGLKNKRDTADIHAAVKTGDVAKLVHIFTNQGAASLEVSIGSYARDYDISLEQDIRDRIGDEDCQHLLIALLGNRPQSDIIDEDLAAKDAGILREAGEGRFSNENGKFILLVNDRSASQLRATLNAYRQLSDGHDINELLEEDKCSENFITAVNALDKSTAGVGQWTEQIHSHLKPNNADLIDVMLERSDNEMAAIRKAYRKRYQCELLDNIIGKCGRMAGPLIAHVAARGGVTPAPGSKQPRPPEGERTSKNHRVNGIRVPSPPRNPPLKGFQPGRGEFAKGTNPLQEVQKRTLGEHIRQDARQKLDRKAIPKGARTDRDGKKKVAKKAGKWFSADDDVKRVKEAMNGSGTDEDLLIQVLASKTNDQRQAIRKTYNDKYKLDLMEDLKSELSGDLEEVVVALMMDTSEYDAYCLHDAVSGMGTNESVLIGILTTRNAKELQGICEQYEEMYDEPLEKALGEDTSGGLGDLLGRLVRGERDQGTEVDHRLVEEDADEIYQDGEASLSVDNNTFKDVMVTRNRNHARAVFDKYEKLSGKSIEDSIKESLAGDTGDGYLGLAQAIISPADFYANRLHEAMTGIGTNDKTLIRILVSRSEVDLPDIKARYKALYRQTLEATVAAETSGEYQKLLLALVKDK